MSLFSEVFGSNSGYQQGARAAASGLQSGYNAATPLYNTGRTAVTTDYANALAPYTALNKSATTGANAYGAALGLGGGDPAQIQAQLAATPGYQFQLGQGLQSIDRGAASRGLLSSGNTAMAEQQYGQGLANQTYQNYVQNLQPYLGQQNTAAAGIAGVNTGLGNTINSSYGNQGNLAFNTQAGIGQAQAAGDIAQANADNSFLSGITGLGTKLLGNVGYNPASGFTLGQQPRTP